MSKANSNRRIKKALRGFVVTFGCLALTSGVLSAIFAQRYWGYIWEAPAVPREVREFDEIVSITPFGQLPEGDASNYMNSDDWMPREQRYLLESSALKQQDNGLPYVDASFIPYYDGYIECNTEGCGTGRILSELSSIPRLLTEVKPMLSQEQLTQVERHIEQSQLLILGEPGYEWTALELRGLVVEAMANGQRFLFLAIHGGQISNDRHTHQELLFKQDSLAETPELIAMNRLFSEVSGIEGLDFRVLWTVLLVLSLFPSLMIAAFCAGPPASRKKDNSWRANRARSSHQP